MRRCAGPKAAPREQNLRLGWLCFLAENYTTAATYYQKAVDQPPYAIEPKFGLVKPLNALGQVEKMLGLYEGMLKLDPRTPRPTTGRASSASTASSSTGQPAASRRSSTSTLSTTTPASRWPLPTSAWAKKTEARALYNRVLLIRPGDASATAGLWRLP